MECSGGLCVRGPVGTVLPAAEAIVDEVVTMLDVFASDDSRDARARTCRSGEVARKSTGYPRRGRRTLLRCTGGVVFRLGWRRTTRPGELFQRSGSARPASLLQ